MQRILIIGMSGLIGSHLALALRSRYQVYGTYRRKRPAIPGTVRFKFDLTPQTPVGQLLRLIRPDVVFYCAGVSDEEACQRSTQAAEFVNCVAPGWFAEALRPDQTPLVYFSSSKVFSGDEGSYHEEHPTSPISLYGGMKVQAELELAQYSKALTLRLGNVFGLGIDANGSGTSRILERIWSGHELPLICDEYRSFCAVDEVVSMCETLLRDPKRFPSGIFHLSNGEKSSYFDLGKKLGELVGHPRAVKAISGAEFDALQGTKWPRGRDLSLDGTRLRDWSGMTIASSLDGVHSLGSRLHRGGW